MPRAFGFDGDSAYHESLEVAVRASETKKIEEKENAEKERRASLGLPEEEKKSWSDRRREKKADPARKKSFSEKALNLVFNGGRSSKAQRWGEERVGLSDGKILKVDETHTARPDGEVRHGEARVVGGAGLDGDGVGGRAPDRVIR